MGEAWAIRQVDGSPEYSARELRRIFAVSLWPAGDQFGARSGVRPHPLPVVTVAGTTWTVHDHSAVVYPGLTSSAGPYIVEQGEQSGSLNPADASNGRIDALDEQVQDDDEDGSGERRSRILYVPGTPEADPVPPPPTNASVRLATILVPSSGSAVVETLAPYTVAAGGVLPVRNADERPIAGAYHGQFVYRRDADELQVFDGAVWRGLGVPDPPRVASGSMGITPTEQVANHYYGDDPWIGSAEAHFPSGLFTAQPRLIPVLRTGLTHGMISITTEGVSTTGGTIRFAATNDTTRTVDWIAVQTRDDQGL